ncbi:LOW QUALITY PROTEIN: hypothetical protein ACHAXT_007949 [Thalassiosira profunda]
MADSGRRLGHTSKKQGKLSHLSREGRAAQAWTVGPMSSEDRQLSGASDRPDRADEAAGDASIENRDVDGRRVSVSDGGADGDAPSRRRSSLANRSEADADDDEEASSRRRSSLATRSAGILSSSSARRASLPKPRPSLQRSNSSLNQSMRNLRHNLRRQSSQSFRALKRQSSTFIEGIHDSLPTTPSGWALLALGTASVGLQYELHVQKELTAPPIATSSRRSSLANRSGLYADDDEEASSRRRSSLATKSAGTSSSSARRASLPKPRPSLQRSNSSLNQSMRNLRHNLRRQSSQSFRALKRQSSTFIEGINDSLPTTPSGWALLALGTASVGLQYELHVQKELTAPPIVFCQNSKGSVLNGRMDRLFDKLSNTRSASDGEGGEEEGIFSRKVTPSLFIGTRGLVSSTAAYALGDGGAKRNVKRFREVMTMGADGAQIVMDWEIPLSRQQDAAIDVTKPNSIDKPVILLLHGLNNDSSFGYIRSMMRTATERGWIAVGMNMRGQDGEHKVKNTTPRGYNAGFTGDLRGVIHQLEHRLKKRDGSQQSAQNDDDPYVGGPIFLLGYSLGANIVTKYLGEESLHGTLPKCIGGGAAMGNPLHIHSGTIAFPWNMLLGAGVKRSILQNLSSFKRHHDPGFQHAIMKKTLLAPTIGKLDDAAAPYLIRNDPHPPYTPRIGFKDGDEYWHDSSSHRYVGHVSVPLLKISAQDDFLVFGQFARKLNHCLENPNVVVVKTRCGGHLGWQESPPPSSKRKGGSWSDAAVADFIEALLQMREEDHRRRRLLADDQPPGPKILSKL